MTVKRGRSTAAEEVVDAVNEESLVVAPSTDLIPTGSTLLNLAFSDQYNGGIQPGTMINLVGDSSGGKCVKDAYILMEEGLILLDTACEVPTGVESTIPWKQTIGLSAHAKSTTSHFYSESVNQTIKIHSRHGFELEGTQNHPILIWTKDCQFEMKKLQNICVGDIAVIAKNTQIFSTTNPSLTKYFPDLRKHPQGIAPDFPSEVDEDFALLLGYIVANGTLGTAREKCYVTLSSKQTWFKQRTDDILNLYGIKWNRGRENGSGGFIGSILFCEFIHNVFKTHYLTAHYKSIPECVLSATKKVQTSFLRGLIDSDGYSAKESSGIHYYTASKILATQVQLLLLNMGILSCKKVKHGSWIEDKFYDHDYYTISIYGNDARNYANQIGSDKYNFSSLMKKKTFIKRHSDYDSIPFLKEKLKLERDIIRKKIGWNKNGKITSAGRFPRFKPFCGQTNMTWNTLTEFLMCFKEYESLFPYAEYQKLSDSFYHFDQITKIESLCYPEETQVYDVHIPEGHQFWSNGFVSHNSLLAWTMFAEVARHPKFKHYRLIYDESEAAFFMDIHKLFGLKDGRVETNIRSATIEEFYKNTLTALHSGEPCIYCLDSFDGISSDAEQERSEKIENGKEVSGGYKMEKAKWASEIFRKIVDDLERTASALIVVSQTRDNIGFGFGDKKTRSGGNALRFYSTHEVWLSIVGHIKAKDREIGANIRFKVKKNKLTGKRREGDFSVYSDYGVDDLASCIDFLIEEKIWSGSKSKLITDSVMFPSMSFQKLLNHIEENGLEEELQKLVGETWTGIEEALKLDRKPRYSEEEEE